MELDDNITAIINLIKTNPLKGIAILSAILIVFLLTVFLVGLQYGIEIGQTDIRNQAVEKGYAEYKAIGHQKTEFKWKVIEEYPTTQKGK